MPRAMPHLEPRWFYRHWRRARPLSVCPAVYAVVVLSLSSACGASVPPCHCTCPVGVLPAHASAATNASAAVGNEQSPQVTKETYALSAAESTPVASAERKEPLSEQELLKRYEGKAATQVFTGKATYYANSLAGRKTASGERYNPKMFTAAHRKLPFGTVVRVVRTDTNRYVYVRITDRGPFAGKERIIDLSYVAAQRLGMIRAGVVPVKVEVLD